MVGTDSDADKGGIEDGGNGIDGGDIVGLLTEEKGADEGCLEWVWVGGEEEIALRRRRRELLWGEAVGVWEREEGSL
mgnify:CR=1 FL=1